LPFLFVRMLMPQRYIICTLNPLPVYSDVYDVFDASRVFEVSNVYDVFDVFHVFHDIVFHVF